MAPHRPTSVGSRVRVAIGARPLARDRARERAWLQLPEGEEIREGHKTGSARAGCMPCPRARRSRHIFIPGADPDRRMMGQADGGPHLSSSRPGGGGVGPSTCLSALFHDHDRSRRKALVVMARTLARGAAPAPAPRRTDAELEETGGRGDLGAEAALGGVRSSPTNLGWRLAGSRIWAEPSMAGEDAHPSKGPPGGRIPWEKPALWCEA